MIWIVKNIKKGAVCFVLFFFLFVLSGSAFAGEQKVGIVVSKRIRPYVEVLEGLVKGLGQKRSDSALDAVQPDVFFLSDSRSCGYIKKRLVEKKYNACVAVGPEACELVWSMKVSHNPDNPDDPRDSYRGGMIYSAVLNPEKIIKLYTDNTDNTDNIKASSSGIKINSNESNKIKNNAGDIKNNTGGCGVSLKIPVAAQINAITDTFPEIENIGLLFDSSYNLEFFEKALAVSRQRQQKQVNIIPLSVNSKKMIPDVLQKNWTRIDCVWLIPDQTVISEKIVQYVIKQALYNKIGVIGYNPFFIKSGAFFSFDFDYREIGLQTSAIVISWLEKGFCSDMAPLFHKTINSRMIKKLGIEAAGEK